MIVKIIFIFIKLIKIKKQMKKLKKQIKKLNKLNDKIIKQNSKLLIEIEIIKNPLNSYGDLNWTTYIYLLNDD